MPDYFVMRLARVRQIRGFSSPSLKGVYSSTRPKTSGEESREDGVLWKQQSALLNEKIRLDAGFFRYEACKSASDSRVFKPEFEGSVL